MQFSEMREVKKKKGGRGSWLRTEGCRLRHSLKSANKRKKVVEASGLRESGDTSNGGGGGGIRKKTKGTSGKIYTKKAKGGSLQVQTIVVRGASRSREKQREGECSTFAELGE